MAKKGSIKKQTLGHFLRTARGRISPEMAGLPILGRRRTPGLRREEVAQLCEISVTWYTWIEQGRDVQVSHWVWSRLADVLLLNPTERAYLFELAEMKDPDSGKARLGSLPAVLEDCVHAVNGPCYLLNRYWDILFFNEDFNTLFNNWPSQQKQANLLDFIFLTEEAKDIVVDWDERARRSVAEFRADTSLYMEEHTLLNQIEKFQSQSDEFSYWWERQTVEAREGGIRGFNHPIHGYQEYEQVTFKLATHLDCKLVMLLPKK